MPRISQLPDTAFPSLDHEVPASLGGETHKLTISQIRGLMKFLSTEINRPGEGGVSVEAALEALQTGKAAQSDFVAMDNAFQAHLEQFGLLSGAFDNHVNALVNAGVGGLAPAIADATTAAAGSYHSFVGAQVAGIAAGFPSAPNAGTGNRTWFLSTLGTATDKVQIAFLAAAANAAEVGFTYVRTSTVNWRRYMMADEGLTEANKASVVRYDAAQALDGTQKQRARSNIGLGSPAEFASTSQLISVVAVSGGYALDYRSSNGEVWRLFTGTAVKPPSGNGDHVINYGLTYLTTPFVVVSNGDATTNPSIILSTYNSLASSVVVTARNADGTAYSGSYRIHYTFMARVS